MTAQQTHVAMINRIANLLPEAAPDVANYIAMHDGCTELQSMYLSLITDTTRALASQGSKKQSSSEHASLVSLVTRIHKDMQSSVAEVAGQVTGPVSAAVMHDMDAKLGVIMRDVDARITQMLTSLFAAHTDQVKQIPALTHSIMADVMRQLSNQLTQTHSELAVVTTGVASVETRLANSDFAKAKKSARKGADAEDQLFDLLTDRLKARDGFDVEKTNGQTASCDILVKRIGSPDIRIESKAHGESTGKKVKHSDVVKFQRDLAQTHSHGIFVSLYSDIVGVSNFELQQLPTGKFAVYLTNLNFDIEPVIEMIHLLYKLDTLVTRSTVDSNNDTDSDTEPVISVSTSDMARVQQYLQDYALTVSSAKQHMRIAIKQLGELDFDKIAKMLLANTHGEGTGVAEAVTEVQTQPSPFVCEQGCGAVFKTKRNMKRHVESRCKINQQESAPEQ